jgi:hypothetical protein
MSVGAVLPLRPLAGEGVSLPITLDWDIINARRAEWNRRWNRMIER